MRWAQTRPLGECAAALRRTGRVTHAAALLLVLSLAACRDRAVALAEHARVTTTPPTSSLRSRTELSPTALPSASPTLSSSAASPHEPPSWQRSQFFSSVPTLPLVTARDAENAGWPKGYVPSLVRESASVRFDGEIEKWTLRWRSMPRPSCFGIEDTGPCLDFGDAEEGDLELVRERPGKDVEVRQLSGFGSVDGNSIVLRRFPRDTPFTRAGLLAAPHVAAMDIADYNGDGEAAEFVLSGLYQAYGQTEHFLVGVTKARPHIHALGTIHHPDEPLTFLGAGDVFAPLLHGEASLIYQACGDHGNDREYVATLTPTPKGFRGSYKLFACDAHFSRGHVIDSGDL